ncbi:MAG: translation initiation factor IF-3 [Formosimonas sp.]|jgi:translation initiation factor IF-3
MQHRINGEITAREVRLIGIDGEIVGVMSSRDALKMAEDADTDLVEISPNAAPPVCRMMDYGKFKFQEQKKASEARAKQHIIQVKEIKFRPGTDENDYQVKLRNVKRFLEAGDKVKISLRFRGREMAHQELGMQLMVRVRDELAEISQVESMPKLEGRQMIMMLSPPKKK